MANAYHGSRMVVAASFQAGSDVRCAAHADVAAAGLCVRCGSFACEACLGPRVLGGQRECARCRALRVIERSEAAILRLRLESWLAAVVTGALIAIVMWLRVAADLDGRRHGVIEALLIPLGTGALFGAPFWVAAMLRVARWRPWTPSLALLCELFGLWWFSIVMAPEHGWVRWIALAAAAYFVIRAVQLRLRLRRSRSLAQELRPSASTS